MTFSVLPSLFVVGVANNVTAYSPNVNSNFLNAYGQQFSGLVVIWLSGVNSVVQIGAFNHIHTGGGGGGGGVGYSQDLYYKTHCKTLIDNSTSSTEKTILGKL